VPGADFDLGQELTILIILSLLFFEECFVKVDLRALFIYRGALFAGICRAGFIKKGGCGFAFVPPMFAAASYFAQDELLAFSDVGLCSAAASSYPSGEASRRFLFARWENISEVCLKGAHIWLNGIFFADCITVQRAKNYMLVIENLKNAPKARRVAIIEAYLAARCDIRAARSALRKIRWAQSGLRLISAVHFLFIFAFLPFYFYISEGDFAFIKTVMLGFIFSVFTASCSIIIFRVKRPVLTFIKWIFMFPFISLYLRDINGGTISDFNPFAALAALSCAGANLKKINRYMRDLKYPVFRFDVPPEIAACLYDFNEALIAKLSKSLKMAGFADCLVLDKYADAAKDTVAYCPKCLAEFTRVVDGCSDCGCRAIIKK